MPSQPSDPSVPALALGTVHIWRLRIAVPAVLAPAQPAGDSSPINVQDGPPARVSTLADFHAGAAGSAGARSAAADPALGTAAARPSWTERLSSNLTTEEQARRMRFRRPEDQWRFALTRGLLRHLLGHYLERPPAEVVLRAGPAGKPILDDDRANGLRFNVSHAHEWALVALTRGREIGVDIEHQRPLSDHRDIARRFFARAEADALDALDPADREAAFYRIWTRKEAFVKATGEGIAWGLDRFTVSHGEGPDVTLRASDTPRTEVAPRAEHARRVAAAPVDLAAWTIRALPVEAGYAAAVAFDGGLCEVITRDWMS